MDSSFWLERWRHNQIGFHQNQFNTHLQEFWSSLRVPEGGKVFAPLCGKSLDMLWLRGQGHSVIGVEISPIAVASFFSENGLNPSRVQSGPFEIWESDGISIFCGDFFDLNPKDMADICGVYDRASLIALPPSMRERYTRHLVSSLPVSAPVLLVTIEYDQMEMEGPPFAVGEEEVRELYGAGYDISILYEHDALPENPQFIGKGVTRMTEKVYILSSKNQ